MEYRPGMVIKHGRMRSGEPRRLDACAQPADGADTPHTARARIVRQDAQHAVLEVLCACGERIYLQCDCTPGAASDGT